MVFDFAKTWHEWAPDEAVLFFNEVQNVYETPEAMVRRRVAIFRSARSS